METMPCREARTYSIRPVDNTTSDVNGWVKVRDNTGITVAAGVVAGAWKRSSKCFKYRSEGEWPE
jgi:hypothetical protein